MVKKYHIKNGIKNTQSPIKLVLGGLKKIQLLARRLSEN